MRTADIEAVGEIAGEALAAGGRLVRDMHEGIAARPFGAIGAAAAPARVLHDEISQAVYDGVGAGLRIAGRFGAQLAATHADTDETPLASRPIASLALGALNGLYGNHLVERGNELALGMEIRRRGIEVPADGAEIANAFTDATPRVVVFVHGLCETEAAWRLAPRGEAPTGTYGDRLQEELGFTPVYVRYNTGLHVSANGRRLARLLEELVTGWPTGVDELVLIGHSMGGLVARSACHYGEQDGMRWTDVVRHIFCLGTPHLGADLEKGTNALARALGRLPETQGLRSILNARSAGIKDLRYGSCVEEDWSDCDPDEFLEDRCHEVPFLPGANYYFIGAALNPGPLGTVLGDLLVRMPSASGRGSGNGRRIPFEIDNGRELVGLNHFHLLNHPAVYAQLRAWITRA
jgi:pimeloyl-ACP methyl ester carboxylesterase